MVAKMHRLHLPKVGEGVIYVPGGVPYEVDPVGGRRYSLGAYMRLGNKGFVYGCAGGSISSDVGAKSSLNQKIGQVAIAVKALIYATELKITSDVSCTEDELVGGEVVVFPAGGNKTFTRGIIGNDAMTATATLTLQLDSPIPVEVIIAGGAAEVIASPYSAVINENNGWTPVMSIPTVPATIGQFLWLQVSGPSWAAPEAEVGATDQFQKVYFGPDGALRCPDDAAPGLQYAGFIIAPNTAGNGQGAPFIMLDVAH